MNEMLSDSLAKTRARQAEVTRLLGELKVELAELERTELVLQRLMATDAARERQRDREDER